MIKGVSRNIIEINHPDSAYFERAVLYLKPGLTDVPLHAAQSETDSYFAQELPLRARGRMWSWRQFLLGMATSGCVCALLVWLLG